MIWTSIHFLHSNKALNTYIHTFLLILEVMWLYRMLKQRNRKGGKKKKTKLNYLQQINIYIALQYCLMDGKAFAWKSVTDLVLTAELGRPFQRGITSLSGKKENLYAFVRAKIRLNLWRWLEPLLLWAKQTDAENVKWVQLCTALYIMVAAFRCRRTSRVSQPSECCIEVTLENCE